MNKYRVENCPCLFNSYYASGKTVRFECNDGNHYDKLCRDVTDCLLKQIVELCKKEIRVYRNTLLPNDGTNTLHFGRQSFAYDILKLLDIQEIE